MCCETRGTLARSEVGVARAFSLIEIMVVLVIIGLLAGLVTINVRGQLENAKRDAARTEIATLVEALELYYTRAGTYPANDEGLEALAEADAVTGEPLMKRTPLDPWGNTYQYNRPGREGPYEVVSLGADGQEGGEGADADLGSWPLEAKR